MGLRMFIIHRLLHTHLTSHQIHQLHQHLILLIGTLIIGMEKYTQVDSCRLVKGNTNISIVLFHSDESLLQEDSSLSADLSSSLHLGDAPRQASGSTRSANFQGHVFATSNPVSTNQRYCHLTILVCGIQSKHFELASLFAFVSVDFTNLCRPFWLQRRSSISCLL